MNKKLGLGLIALLAVILICGTIGYIGLHRYRWNSYYSRNAGEMMKYRTWQDDTKCWNVMNQDFYREGVPFAGRNAGMMYYRMGHDERRHEGGGLIGILVLLLVAFGAYYYFSKYEKRSRPQEILKERFARSEITKEQYEEMKKVLE
jgi:uncharacterized membrane protein